MVWLKIRKNDISNGFETLRYNVVVWLKIRKNDILCSLCSYYSAVVVWLKIRKNDIKGFVNGSKPIGCGLIKD